MAAPTNPPSKSRHPRRTVTVARARPAHSSASHSTKRASRLLSASASRSQGARAGSVSAHGTSAAARASCAPAGCAPVPRRPRPRLPPRHLLPRRCHRMDQSRTSPSPSRRAPSGAFRCRLHAHAHAHGARIVRVVRARAGTRPTTTGRAVHWYHRCCCCHCARGRSRASHMRGTRPRTSPTRPSTSRTRARARRRSCLRRAGGCGRARSTACPGFGDDDVEREARTSFTSLLVKRTVERRQVGPRSVRLLDGELQALPRGGAAIGRIRGQIDDQVVVLRPQGRPRWSCTLSSRSRCATCARACRCRAA